MTFHNELLDEVCHGIDADSEDDLITLASLCTRLHDIALPIYFARLGLDADGLSLRLGYSGLSLIDHTLKVLKGIRLSLARRSGPAWLQRLTSLDCLFKFGQTTPAIFSTIQTLINHIHIISRLHLNFRASPLVDSEFYMMIMAVGDKSCTSLEIFNLPQGYRCPLAFRPINTLKNVVITSDNDHIFDTLDWLVLSINSSPIRTLEMQLQNENHILALLFRLEVPNLTNLDVFFPTSIDKMMPFLRRHPRITDLHAAVDQCPPDKLDMCTFEHLTKLSATPDLVALLLSQPGRAPNLSKLHLFTDSSYCAKQCWEPRFSGHEMELIQVFTALPNYPAIYSLSLTIFEKFGSREWDLEDGITGQTNSLFPLRQIKRFDVYTELELVHLLPDFIYSLPNFVPVLFPSLKALVVDVPEKSNVEKLPLVRQLRVACPTLLKISFSRNISLRPITEYL
jgi:hypothetical protein